MTGKIRPCWLARNWPDSMRRRTVTVEQPRRSATSGSLRSIIGPVGNGASWQLRCLSFFAGTREILRLVRACGGPPRFSLIVCGMHQIRTASRDLDIRAHRTDRQQRPNASDDGTVSPCFARKLDSQPFRIHTTV